MISHAILTYNSGRKSGFADGIVITPSHNPPRDGGFKYHPPSGGPAQSAVTDWIVSAIIPDPFKELTYPRSSAVNC